MRSLVNTLLFVGALALPGWLASDASAVGTGAEGRGAPPAITAAAFEANVAADHQGGLIRVVSPSDISEAADATELLHMPIERLLALAGGVAIGTSLVGSVIGGSQFIGILAGGVIGEFWYRNQLPPLNLFH